MLFIAQERYCSEKSYCTLTFFLPLLVVVVVAAVAVLGGSGSLTLTGLNSFEHLFNLQ